MKVNIKHLAKLANLTISPKEEKRLSAGFTHTLKSVAKLNQLKLKKTLATFQVTKLQNVWREDKLQPERGLTQKQALSNALKTHHGFFIVNRVIHHEA